MPKVSLSNVALDLSALTPTWIPLYTSSVHGKSRRYDVPERVPGRCKGNAGAYEVSEKHNLFFYSLQAKNHGLMAGISKFAATERRHCFAKPSHQAISGALFQVRKNAKTPSEAKIVLANY